MRKLFTAAFVMLFAAGAVYANQQCFYGANCKDGKIVMQKNHVKKPWMKRHWARPRKGSPFMHKAGGPKACPMMKEGKHKACAAGGNCGCKHGKKCEKKDN
jgi:hypothetical protein